MLHRLIVMALLSATVSSAQVRGYINGQYTLTSFNAATGEIIDSFPTGGTGTKFAVALNDITLYVPTVVDFHGVLKAVNGLTGQPFYSLPFPQGFASYKMVLTSQGGTAFLSGGGNSGLIAINLSTRTVTAAFGLPPAVGIDDLAISPDDSTLYVSVTCSSIGCSNPPGGGCPVLKGICAFDVRTLALKGILDKRHGYLSVSQDSKTLYVNDQGALRGELFIVDAATLLVKDQIIFHGSAVGPVVVSPVGHYAVVLESLNPGPGTAAYVLDTAANQIVSTLFADAPLGGSSSIAAFAPNGASLWMILGCSSNPDCALPNPGGLALTGLAFPSGEVINTVEIPKEVVTLAFPRTIRH